LRRHCRANHAIDAKRADCERTARERRPFAIVSRAFARRMRRALRAIGIVLSEGLGYDARRITAREVRMPRQKSLVTVIRDMVKKEVGAALSGLFAGLTGTKASANKAPTNGRRKKRGPGRPRTVGKRGPGRPPGSGRGRKKKSAEE
jgi:hypothetical protein